MNQANVAQSEASSTDPVRLPRRLRFELIFNGVLLAIGLFLVPAAVFFTGQALLGEYSTDGTGILNLYGSILRDMGRGDVAPWLLVLSPMLGITLLRVLWLPLRARSDRDQQDQQPAEKL
ncbi:MAG: hypothetical protein WBN31_09300 [Gammaproteobacteria bacterium]